MPSTGVISAVLVERIVAVASISWRMITAQVPERWTGAGAWTGLDGAGDDTFRINCCSAACIVAMFCASCSCLRAS